MSLVGKDAKISFFILIAEVRFVIWIFLSVSCILSIRKSRLAVIILLFAHSWLSQIALTWHPKLIHTQNVAAGSYLQNLFFKENRLFIENYCSTFLFNVFSHHKEPRCSMALTAGSWKKKKNCFSYVSRIIRKLWIQCRLFDEIQVYNCQYFSWSLFPNWKKKKTLLAGAF